MHTCGRACSLRRIIMVLARCGLVAPRYLCIESPEVFLVKCQDGFGPRLVQLIEVLRHDHDELALCVRVHKKEIDLDISPV